MGYFVPEEIGSVQISRGFRYPFDIRLQPISPRCVGTRGIGQIIQIPDLHQARVFHATAVGFFMATGENRCVTYPRKMDAVIAFRKSEFDLVAHIIPRRAVKHDKLAAAFVIHYGGVQDTAFLPRVVRVRLEDRIAAVFYQFHFVFPPFVLGHYAFPLSMRYRTIHFARSSCPLSVGCRPST